MDIYVKNRSYELVGVIDVFESLIWTDRYYEPGDFELYTSVTQQLLTTLQENYYLQIKDSDRTMIIESIQIKTDVETGNKLIVRGRSLESILDRRVVWDQTLLNTNIQLAILQLVDEAFINPTHAAWEEWRKVNNMIWAISSDPLVTTPPIKAQYHLDNLLDVVISLCKQTFIGFKMVLNSSNQFVSSVYAGADRSYAQSVNPYLVFSTNFDNLLSSDYRHTSRPFKTLAVILAAISELGEYLRVTRGIGPGQYWQAFHGIDHRELYVDATHIPDYYVGTTDPIVEDDYIEQVRQYGADQLAKNTIMSSFDGQVGTVKFKYLTDYFMGDIVQIENQYGLTARSRITEVIISENLNGRGIYPTFEAI